MTNTKPETIYKPKYNGSMRFAMLLYPVWVGLFVYYLYQLIVTHSYSPQGILTVVFGIMAFSLPFRVFREVRFGENITVKRYLLPDLIIEYKDIIAIDKMRLDTATKGISLYMINYDSIEELERLDEFKEDQVEEKIREVSDKFKTIPPEVMIHTKHPLQHRNRKIP